MNSHIADFWKGQSSGATLVATLVAYFPTLEPQYPQLSYLELCLGPGGLSAARCGIWCVYHQKGQRQLWAYQLTWHLSAQIGLG